MIILFFFDQDSKITENYINDLISQYSILIANGFDVGCVGPVYFNNSNNRIEIPKVKIQLTDTCYKVKGIITSSMLTTYKNLSDVNFWNKNIFLDMADWDICWRMMSSGKLCCITTALTLDHTLGNGEKKIGPLRIRVGNPIREYYQTRDCLYLLSERYVPIKFKLRFIGMLTIRPILHILFLESKKERFNFIKRGIIDHHKGINGEFVVKKYKRKRWNELIKR